MGNAVFDVRKGWDKRLMAVDEDAILKIQTLMTMVGGEIIVLPEALAGDFGVESVAPPTSRTRTWSTSGWPLQR